MQVTILPMNVRIEAQAGENLLEVMKKENIPFYSPCGGKGTCGKCKVLISKGNNGQPKKEEMVFLSTGEIEKGIRLACFLNVVEDTCVIIEERKEKNMRNVKHEISIEGAVGIVFDMGTTTIQGALYHLDTKKEIHRISLDNAQGIFGGDVVSRITYCIGNKEKEKNLQESLRKNLLYIIREFKRNFSFEYGQIKKIIAVGNTTISHFFAGFPVEGLMKMPFETAFQGGHMIDGSDIFPVFDKDTCSIFLPRHIGGHIGSDMLACLIGADILDQEGNFLLVDIGTNAEIVLYQNRKEKQDSFFRKCIACSVAAGPAFEGASIKYGMKNQEGAIHSIFSENGQIKCIVEGGKDAKGICGSGLIDGIAELLNNSVITNTGLLVGEDGKPRRFVPLIVNSDGSKVELTQEDIREFQLGKAAIQSGILMLLEKENISLNQVEQVYLAGSFGSSIRIENAIRTGLLPSFSKEKIRFIGNGAMKGGEKILFGDLTFDEANEIALFIEHVELAGTKRFQERFLQSIDF